MKFSSARILYYISNPQRMSGSNRSLFELVTHLPAWITPLVVLSAEGMVANAYREAGVEVHVLKPAASLRVYGKALLEKSWLQRGSIFIRDYLPYLLRLRRFIDDAGVDLVHINDPRGALLVGPAARLARRRIVVHARGESPFGGWIWWFFQFLPDRIITVADALQAAMKPWAQAKATTVYNGTRNIAHLGGAIPWLQSLREAGVVVVCCFATITPFKGYHHLLNAVEELNRRGYRDRAFFVCVGDLATEKQAYQDWILQQWQARHLDNLMFTGWQDDPFSFYRMADITVLPSVTKETFWLNGTPVEVRGNEGFPRTHLEAMCFGLPIVGTRIAGVTEQVIDGETGFVVPPSDAHALATALEQLIDNPALRQRMGAAGRERVRRCFSTEAYVAGVLDVYESLLAGG